MDDQFCSSQEKITINTTNQTIQIQFARKSDVTNGGSNKFSERAVSIPNPEKSLPGEKDNFCYRTYKKRALVFLSRKIET